MQRRLSPRLLLALCTVVALSCTPEGEEEGGETETSGETGDADDDVCELESPFTCECLILDTQWFTAGIVYGEPEVASTECISLCWKFFPDIDDSKITPIDCSEIPPQTDCTDWPPARAVRFDEVSGVRLVERALVERLMLDPAPLMTCDDAVLVHAKSGGCRVMNSSAGELVHELGLRDDDVLHSLNQQPVQAPLDLLIAFNKLWSQGATSFEVELLRNGHLLTLRYKLVKS